LPAAATFDVQHAAYEMAARGFGVALAASLSVGPYLDAGRLVSLGLPAAPAPLDGAYRLVAPRGRPRREVKRVRDWLVSAARATPDAFATAPVAVA
jgi:DNA-binding transcriptional LysR family regulator